jgi:hypothetical protein
VVCLLDSKTEDSSVNERVTALQPATPLASLDFVEPLLTIREAADALRWSYDTARRYFKDQPGVLVKHQSSRYKRPYRTYMIPRSVLHREWQKMASCNARRAA